ncbi:gp60 protein [Mycobacteroides abscessus]|nr:gp60 protein [Mycobacteroides abscessus]CPR88632.1 gp60 protein [Mycobacteroides abscessus]CPS43571.1 gp60 protein [Mycobacteroides abscessus]CPV03369.1 gp60 protein [Mycobacteroides abscessus]
MEVDGVHGDVPDTEYHADRSALSSSGARLLLPPSTPAHFRAAMSQPPKTKREYDFGHAAHKFVLGEGEEIVPVHANDWRTNAAKEQRAQAYADGKIPLLAREVDVAMEMARAVFNHPTARKLLADGVAEVSLAATDPETGIRLKARPDWMNPEGGRLRIVDYKTSTTSDPSTFSRKAFDLGYHIQEAWYRAVARLARLDPEAQFVFIVQEKEYPYEVAVVEFDDEAALLGAQMMQRAIAIYRDCIDRDIWPGRPTDITSISLPSWATRASRWVESTREDNSDLIAALEAALTEGTPE